VRSLLLLGGRGGAAGDVGEGGHAEADRLMAAGDEAVNLGQLVVRGGEADLQPLGFAGPAFPPGLADGGRQVVADLFQPRAPGRVNAEERAPDTRFSELSAAW
jgi:hypothetical protein